VTKNRPFGAVCIGVHGIFAEGADARLTEQAAQLVTCNTIPHPSNAIDITSLLADCVRDKD
jgi:ribose-phosphate pyrophosphokinase